MKKLSVLSALFGLMFVGAASAANITIYHSPSCPHCHHAREFFKDYLIYEYPTLSITEVNVMDESNRTVFLETLEKCKYESGGVPVIVVGEKCFQGYADFMQDELREAVEADMSDADKATAAENKKALAADAEAFRSANASRTDAISQYKPGAQKKIDNAGSVNTNLYWYVLLIAAVVVLGIVLVKRKK
ncbi:MAG: hypothetical protein K2M34_01470 [Alphaproteobacteria bacterium]|nr:hypothetical protein [Alphaproteobacteria bacterium]